MQALLDFITHWKDLIEVFVWIFGTIAIVYGFRQYRMGKKQFQFDVMISCIERYQELVPELVQKRSAFKGETTVINKYIDLCNEELFYFKNGYLPEEVVVEWLDGMIDILPLFDEKGININGKSIISAELLINYPRIKSAFTVGNKQFDLQKGKERKNLIELIKHRNSKYKYQQFDKNDQKISDEEE